MRTVKKIEKEELEKQAEFVQGVKERLAEEEQRTGRKQAYFIFTTGCQMNAHDSEKLAGMLESMGYQKANSEETADFILYNTCCIRENAEEKIYGRLGRLKYYKTKNPNLKIAICGCMTQQNIVLEKLRKSYRFVDIVFGTFNLYRLPELILASMEMKGTLFDIWDESRGVAEDIPTLHQNPFKASVNIMYGCNNFCSYCIVPYVRGREHSRQMEDILAEVRSLAKKGVREVMLLGQNVNSYGKNLSTPVLFSELLRQVDQIEGIDRINFMTSHPKDLSDDLILAMKECKHMLRYLHLPVQSGSSRILEKMNRRYTREHYLDIVRKVRTAIPELMLSTDIIVGFPGETEEDFLETLSLVKEVRYSTAFTFIYSKRTGTPAAVMENQVPEPVVKERFDRLLAVLNPLVHEVSQTQLGKTLSVLVEEESKNHDGILTGRAENNSLVHFQGPVSLIGEIVPVKIVDNKTFYLLGERVSGEES